MTSLAYSYIRFSTKEQIKGDSLNRQIAGSKKWCDDNGVQLSDKNFQDLGISAFKEKDRASLFDMMTAIENGNIKKDDYIIIESFDRLSRQGIDKTQDIIKFILRADVKIVSLQDNMLLDKTSLDDLVAVVRVALSADLAHKESLKKSERILAAKAKQRNDAVAGIAINKRLPYWLKNQDGSYVFNDRVGALKMIIELRKKGEGFHRIAMALNESEYCPRTVKYWSDTTVRDLIKSRALYGSYVTGTVVERKFIAHDEIKNYYPALLTYIEWKDIQSKHVRVAGGIRGDNHLARLVRCSVCDGAMSKKIQKSKTKTTTHVYNTWVCVKHKSGGCSNRMVITDLDKFVFASTKRFTITEQKSINNDLEQSIDETNARIEECEIELKKRKGKSVTRLLSAMESMEEELEELHKQKESETVTTDSEIQVLNSLIDDGKAYNIALRKIVEVIKVRVMTKNSYVLEIHQRNGNIVRATVVRKSQRNPWKILFKNDLEQLRKEVVDMNSDWADDYDSDEVR